MDLEGRPTLEGGPLNAGLGVPKGPYSVLRATSLTILIFR